MGPLKGFKIIELVGIGPGPFCGMMLADMGAEVISIEKADSAAALVRSKDVAMRGRRSVSLNLKHPDGVEALLKLCESADAIFEGFRPGVAERLGIGPEQCMARNPKLVYGRITGWGQEGPLAQAAGHDINYIALSGALHAIGPKNGKPVPPLNLVGDFGGGGMLIAFGIVCALLEAQKSGKGQVVDSAMVDGAAALMSMFFTMRSYGGFQEQRGSNILDGGAHFYDTYETSDGKYISIGAIEPQFYNLLLEKIGVDRDHFSAQMDATKWPQYKESLTSVFKCKTRDEWCEILEGTDVCFAPVLSIWEAPNHPHNQARDTFVDIDGMVQPAPAPRFSRTVAEISSGPRPAGEDTSAVLAEWGFDQTAINKLQESGALS